MAGRSTVCTAALLAYFVAYVCALGVAIVGTQGLMGFEPNGIAIVWLVFLGMPWTLLLAMLPSIGVPALLAQLFIAATPLFNIWLLSLLCPRRRKRRS